MNRKCEKEINLQHLFVIEELNVVDSLNVQILIHVLSGYIWQ